MDNTQVDFEKDDYRFMKQAITQAKKAYKLNEVPIGCIIVYEGKVIGRGYNRRNTDKTSLGHAEITAIKKASKYMLRLNHVRCVQVLLFRQEFQELLSAQ